MASHVLLVTQEFPPQLGGAARYYGGLAAALVEVTVLSSVVGPADERTIRASWSWPVWPRWLPLLWLVPYHAFRSRSRLVAAGQLLPVGAALLAVRLAFGLPYVVFSHGLDLTLARRNRWKRLLTRLVLRQAALVVSNSDFTRGLAVAGGAQPTRTIVVYPSTSLPLAPAGAGSALRQRFGLAGAKVVLTVARLVPRKGVAEAAVALGRLVPEHPTLTYVVVGEGPERDRIAEAARSAGVRLVLPGAASDAELAAWYQAADVFVLLPRFDLVDVEGFGTVYLEAMAAGVPVVGSRVGGVPEAIGQAGVLVADTGELPDALARLLADPKLRARYARLGQQRVRSFTWQAQGEVLREALANLPSGR